MPHRRLIHHVRNHPYRLAVTVFVISLLGWGFAGFAFVRTISANHERDVEICRQINLLREDIYIASVDVGVPAEVAERFLKEGCNP